MASYEEFSYTLQEDEIIKALRASGYYHAGPVRIILELLVLLALSVFFLVSFFLSQEKFNLAMALVCLIVAGFLYFLPRHDAKKKAAQAEKDVRLRLYPTALYYYGSGDTVEIPLKQAKIFYDEKDQIMAVMPENGGFLTIPFRALPKERKAQISHQLLQFVEKKK